MYPDVYAVMILELALFGLTSKGLYEQNILYIKETWRRVLKRPPHPVNTISVRRGDVSMRIINGAFATTFSGSLAIVGNADGLNGWQAFFMIINTVALSYLFYFNTWWRNSVLLPLSAKIKHD